MSLRPAIHSCLLADTGVTALLGAGAACRHYPEQAPPAAAAPLVVSNHIASVSAETHGAGEDTLDETTIQFSCFAGTAEDPSAALALRLAVRKALLDDAAGVLATAGIKVTQPVERTFSEPLLNQTNAQLDLTFFHNPRA